MEKEIQTFLIDEQYDDLYKLVKRKGKHTETFAQDKGPTKFWIRNGCLYSQMRGEPFIKKVVPLRDMPTEIEPASGMARAIDYLSKKFNRDFHEVTRVVLMFYVNNNLPKQLDLPQEVLDMFQPPNGQEYNLPAQ